MQSATKSLVTICLSWSFALAGPAAAQSDPGVPGPLEVSSAEYDYGDDAFDFGGRPTEMRAIVYYPTDLSGARFPSWSSCTAGT